MRAGILGLLWCCSALIANAGSVHDPMAARHARIDSLYRIEQYADVVREITVQLAQAKGTVWQDSLYRYTYRLGRSTWKTQSAEAGVAAAQQVCTEVERSDRNALHVITAMADLSQLHYEVGRIADCLRVDSFAMVFADAHTELPAAIRGKAHYRVGSDHGGKGDHEQAIRHYLRAQAIYATSDTLLRTNMAETCNGLGVSAWHLGRTRDAEKYYRMALESLGDDDDPDRMARRASTFGNLGILWQSAGDLTRSKMYYQESLRVSEQVIRLAKDPAKRDAAILNRAKGYLNLATVYFAIGDDGRAGELLDLSLRDRRTILEPGDPKLLLVQDRMASLEMASGDLARAEKHVTEYMLACEKYYGRLSEDHIMARSKLADIAARQGRTGMADTLFQQSIAWGGQLADADTDPGRAITFKRRATMYQDIGRHSEALQDLSEARAIIARIHGPEHYKVAECDALLAEAAFRAGDVDAAQRHSSSALQLLHDRGSVLDSNAAPQIFPEPGLVPDAIYWKVRAERMRPDAVHSEEWAADLDRAIRTLERNKAALGDKASQLQLVASQTRLFELALDVAFDAYQRSGSVKDIDWFLALSEADRSILLKSRLNEFAGLRFAGVPDSLITREQELLLALDIDPEDRATALELPRKEKEYRDLLEQLRRDHPKYHALRYGETRVTLDEVRRGLVTKDRDLLLYAMGREHLYMLVVTQDTTVLLRVDNTGTADKVKALNSAINEQRDADYLTAAHDLYRTVFAPVRSVLRNTGLFIVPDGELHTVNFEVLLTKPSTRKDFRSNLLIQDHAIAYLLSATTALQFKRMEQPPTSGVLALAPGFSDDLKQEYLTHVKDSASIDRQYLRFVRQPFAVDAAEELSGLLSARIMVGAEAHEQGFREQAERYNILHLGTHAEMNPTSPMYSRLVLSKNGGGAEADADGYLHAYEIYEMDLNAQLAVLTACETGAGKNDDGEGVRSLGYGFAYAGCPSLVMSLWKIDEKISSEIITRFYANLAEGMPKHQALRQAKLDHLAQAPDELALPYYWAGMVLVGDVEPLELSSWKRYQWWVIGIVVLMAIAVIVYWRRSARTAA